MIDRTTTSEAPIAIDTRVHMPSRCGCCEGESVSVSEQLLLPLRGHQLAGNLILLSACCAWHDLSDFGFNNLASS
jgi:hypothetical protein